MAQPDGQFWQTADPPVENLPAPQAVHVPATASNPKLILHERHFDYEVAVQVSQPVPMHVH